MFCFSIGKKILDRCEGDFCIEVSPSVFGIKQTVLYIKWMQVAGFIQSFQNRVCILGWYVKCFRLWCWTSLFLFSYMKTLFLHNVFLWMLTCFCTVLYFLYVCVWERVCAIFGREHERLCACMRTRFRCGAVFRLLSRPYRSHFLLEKKKHSCCLVTSLWLHIIYYAFLLLCQTFTKYDILSLLVSLCIIQSKMPYLASIFCIDVLLHLHILGTCYHVCVQFVLCLYAYTALMMCII